MLTTVDLFLNFVNTLSWLRESACQCIRYLPEKKYLKAVWRDSIVYCSPFKAQTTIVSDVRREAIHYTQFKAADITMSDLNATTASVFLVRHGKR